MRSEKTLAIIIPCFNEEEALEKTAAVLLQILIGLIRDEQVSDESRICFVNDGSRDGTWPIIEKLCNTDRHFSGIDLSRNFGHQGALLAGLFTLQADACITIDADLQDDEKAILKMVEEFHRGVDVVYGVRKDRDSDSFFKRATAVFFYRTIRLLGAEVIHNHADFRLLSKRAVEALKSFPERNLFLRAMVPLLGFPATSVFYDRKPREKGESKYPSRKMLAFAWEGITGFSVGPLKIVTALGVATCCLSLLLIAYSVFRWVTGATVLGWASLVTIVCTLSSVQLLSIGIIGEYVGKIYRESKRRPVFIIQNMLSHARAGTPNPANTP